MIDRRHFLKSTALGSGAMALAPSFNQLFANPEGPNAGDIPRRFIFIRKSSGLRPLECAPVDFTDEQKKLLLASVTQAVHESIGASLPSIRVWINEFGPHEYMAAGELAADRKK